MTEEHLHAFIRKLYVASNRALDRFHLVIAAAVSWAVVATGVMLASGWDVSAPPELFIVGIIPIVASYYALVHLDRRYHRYERMVKIMQEKYVNLISRSSSTNLTDQLKVIIDEVKSVPPPTFFWSFNHMTIGPYGSIYAALILSLIISYFLKTGN